MLVCHDRFNHDVDKRLPTGFLPSEDQGESMVQFSCRRVPYLNEVMLEACEIEHYFLNEEGNNTEGFLQSQGLRFSGSGHKCRYAFVHSKIGQSVQRG